MSKNEDIDFDNVFDSEDEYWFWSEACHPPWKCRGFTRAGEPCNATCRKVKFEEYWSGVSDRCVHHVDEVARRARDIARTARRTGAADVEALLPYERHHRLKEIRLAEQARTAAARRSASSPVEPTSRRANGATGLLPPGFAAPLAAKQPPGFGSGPRSLADRLEEPPQLEPGPKPTLSNAIEIKKGERN